MILLHGTPPFGFWHITGHIFGYIVAGLVMLGLIGLFIQACNAGWAAFGPDPKSKKKTPEEQSAEPTSDELISNIENLMEQLKQKQSEEKAKDQGAPQ